MVAITTFGLSEDTIGADEAAAIVGAAMISMLVLPLMALRVGGRAGDPGRQ
ncbi:hypothetical protein GLX30_03115 [Streptomyces sp. Tu 2975]|nr:hypothetical protein GLX30_03115 [Streptomyces sp. Tu 2975]